MTLGPGRSGAPWVAYQEIIVWVTSWGWKEPPLRPQRVRGAFGSATSASTALVAPWSVTSASWAAGWPAQLAWRAAQEGTATGVGSIVGVGDGLGLSSGLGRGLGLGDGECLATGLLEGARGPLAVQAPIASRETRRTTPFLTGACNERGIGGVTEVSAGGKVAQDSASRRRQAGAPGGV